MDSFEETHEEPTKKNVLGWKTQAHGWEAFVWLFLTVEFIELLSDSKWFYIPLGGSVIFFATALYVWWTTRKKYKAA